MTLPGTGKHTFNYPPVSVTIDGTQGISTSNATASAYIRGKVDGIHVKTKGDNFGSLLSMTIINQMSSLLKDLKQHLILL